ncbi:GNAT family N-acetyltransferase [Streptomyces sp. CA-142005]|uniref:GNAT family N-acetyltransferase n=1 Tax=Streptomyces sp. CA-142005 TaxID=3240052 RepID=UPI003D94AAD5
MRHRKSTQTLNLQVSRSAGKKEKETEVNAVLELRQARVSDHDVIGGCVQQWWNDSRTPDQARELSLLLPRLFLQFFSSTSLVLEDDEEIRAFLIGFHAADNEEETYIHFVGVDPTLRGQGAFSNLRPSCGSWADNMVKPLVDGFSTKRTVSTRGFTCLSTRRASTCPAPPSASSRSSCGGTAVRSAPGGGA